MGISVSVRGREEIRALLTDARAAHDLNSRAMNEVVRSYEPLIMSVVLSLGRPASMFDDLMNGGRWGVVQAVRHHDGRSEGFTSYLKQYVRGEALRAVARHDSEDIPSDPADLPDRPAPEIARGDDVDVHFDELTDAQNCLVLARYRDDMRLSDIARSGGCSVSAVSQRLKTIHRALAHRFEVAA